MDNLVGQHVGPYRLLARVRSDGVTTLYKAQEPPPDRIVAITILSAALAQEDTFGERLRREARTLARLHHAHTVRFFDHGQFQGRPYLVTGFVEGVTLRDRLFDRALSLPEMMRIVGQIGSALDYAHQLGIVHRDVRPGNVLLDVEGDAFLTGFGLADIVRSPGAPGWLGVGVGDPAYMSPEQVRGQPADARSDVYSLAVMLYRMTTGRLPHRAETPLGMALQQIEELPPPPRTLRPDLPEDAEHVIQRALAPEPLHRFPSAGEMVEALDGAVKGVEPAGRRVSLLAEGPREERERSSRVPTPVWSVVGPVIGGLALLLLILLLVRLPIRVRLEGGEVAVVRVIDRTATPPPAAGAATSAPMPTPTSAPTPTPLFVTATPVALPTNTPLPPVINPEARAFAEPILAAIADRSPTFRDDFEPGDGEWTWDAADAGAAELDYGIVDGVARVELTDGATVRLGHPQLEATDFVLRVDSRQVGGASSSEQQVFLHFVDTYVNVTLVSGARYWWSGVPWYPNDAIDGEGAVVRPMGETNQTMLIVQGEQLAVYLNGTPVLYLEEPTLNAVHWISFWCHGVPDAVCEFDNVQLWELEG